MLMIRVLHIHTLPIVSGSGINTFLSMKGMERKLYEVELACAPGGRLIQLVQENDMKVRPFKHMVQPLHPLKDTLALLDLTAFLKRNPYHIVHTHNSKAGFLGRLAAKLTGVPVIIHTVHGFAFHDQEPLWRQTLFRNLERLGSHWCDKMIFISQPLIDWALRDRIVGEEKIAKIYSGIQLDLFRPIKSEEINKIRKKWKLREKEPVIGIVSKLWEGKGHVILIDAFKLLKKRIEDARLVIVGEGYLYNKLMRLADMNGLRESVLFTGFQMDVSEIIATFDVAVLPSFFEGMGRVLLEAMAMEKPVVASCVGGIPDLVEHGINGLLVRPGNVKELADALEKILSDKRLANKMGREGRKKIKEQFSSDVMVESIEKVYRELLARKGVKVES
ncbi:MAG: glycosyltransferase family 4 protein [Deltaproteobacteria bacterium]|nr:MAG: glycosyltransferase family 4 protein [Deltaproteobacteria bacterium]